MSITRTTRGAMASPLNLLLSSSERTMPYDKNVNIVKPFMAALRLINQ